ncbi:NAD-dependent succinate-semialdehyde dehydrogenase [Nocardioides sp. J2M5]|uniref:NAD-dependent succinate-semialdehyde dehydrogenase n=1 Tax=Nocardioides TaxID=1839 RepID=UPI001BA5B135|nr:MULTISPECIES: NAD-dependent succinate-semialdehyde dehydrogenase [Nocardioides]MBS2937970.1 NAD-dependent succinate-semialdehyde dehydrogenase [Nocardioides palaemonis]
MSKYVSTDPATGVVVKEFDSATDAEVDSAVEAAHTAYGAWRRADVAERTGLLQRIADTYRERSEELAALMTTEMGKPVAQARGEVALAASIFEYYAAKGPEFLEEEQLDIAGQGSAVVRTEAIGALVGVMPWNYPHYQVARFVAPNLLLGNTILLKHASNCPQQALAIADLVEAAGAPAGVYQNVFATNDQVARMIAHPFVQGVSLTGSERAGQAVGSVAGAHMKKCVLELGGSDPFIVLADADPAAAAREAATGRFANAGQACTSSKRIIVEDAVWDSFLEEFLRQAASWQLGDPARDETKLGPMSSVAGRADLEGQVQDAVAKGATVHLGGSAPDGPGAYYPATVLSGVDTTMRAYQEELFGPVAVLYRVRSAEEAVAVANDSPFGLGAAVFGGDEDHARQVADQLDVGMVGINTTIKSAPDLPFGGVKASGVGRELGRFGLDEFANKKLVRKLTS